MVENYENMFGMKSKKVYTSPIKKGDHPELDNLKELDMDGIKKYQSLIGALQWAVSIGRLDIATAVMTMSKFRSAPREGHMSRVRRIVGFLYRMKHATICFRVNPPDMSAIGDQEYDWEKMVYGKVCELVPHDAPEPLGKP